MKARYGDVSKVGLEQILLVLLSSRKRRCARVIDTYGVRNDTLWTQGDGPMLKLTASGRTRTFSSSTEVGNVGYTFEKKVRQQDFYPECEYGGYSRVDGTVAFYGRVQTLLRPNMVALDVGCGRGEVVDRLKNYPYEKCRILKGACKKVVGIDVSDDGYQNKLIDEFRRIEGDRWPVDSASIDFLISDNVMEHVTNPDAFFAECRRVMKLGGIVCLRTTNKWAYHALAAAMIPNSLHVKILSLVQPNRKAIDTFPTYFRANTVHTLNRLLEEHAFKGYVYRHISEPPYFSFSSWAYKVGVVVHRWLPSIFWSSIFVFGRRR